MGFDVFRNSQQGAGFVLCVVFSAICILATVLRVVSTKRAGHKIGMEDWFAVAALAFFLAYVGLFLNMLILSNGHVEAYEVDPAVIPAVLKSGWAMSAQFAPNQTFAKFSLLALYHRLFSVDRTFVICVWTIAFLQLGWGVAVCLVHYFGCTPVSKSWDPLQPGKCIDVEVFLLAKEPINSVIDFAMAALAVWMLRFLRIKRTTKFKVSLLFLVGALSGVIGFVKIAESRNSRGSSFLNAIWDVVQMATSIICCSAPMYKSIFPDLGIISRLRSWGSRSLISFRRPTASSSSGSPHRQNKEQDMRTPPWVNMDWWSLKDVAAVEEKPHNGAHEHDNSPNGRNVRPADMV